LNNPDKAIAATRCWVEKTVVGHNFCPFARSPLEAGRVRFAVTDAGDDETALYHLIEECRRLDENPEIETTLLILTGAYHYFDDFLRLIELGNRLLSLQGYEGTYQLAHFHPDYRFADSDSDDPANYTNRSPHPTLHIIREASLERAIASHPDVDAIPKRNVEHARALGTATFRAILLACGDRKA